MTPVVLIRKSTLLMPSGPAHDPDRKHLFVILTEPSQSPTEQKEVLLVSISSANKNASNFDPTCILMPGDHPFIHRESFIDYRHAIIESRRELQSGVKSGDYVLKEPMKLAVVERICRGLENSPNTPDEILDFYHAAISN